MRKLSVLALAILCASCGPQFDGVDEVRLHLIDPESARFSHVNTEHGVTCGLVNSRGPMGGYTGNIAFAVKDGHVSFQGDRDFAETSNELQSCSLEVVDAMLAKITRELK